MCQDNYQSLPIIIANVKSFGFPRGYFPLCHSRENGNPEYKLQIPHQVRNDNEGSVIHTFFLVIPPHLSFPRKLRIQTLEYHSRNFSCHSRVSGNPEFRFRVKHGMTEGIWKKTIERMWNGRKNREKNIITISFVIPALFLVTLHFFLSPHYSYYHSRNFSCHSRECGNPELIASKETIFIIPTLYENHPN